MEGKVVIVTGGGKGIARHAVTTFAQEKALRGDRGLRCCVAGIGGQGSSAN